ncbi:unnamed protein product, partial [Ectocarpus sp. 12 AP-2014]
AIAKDEDGLAATFRNRSGREDSVYVDALCMNAGFEPQNEILRLLGAQMHYDKAMGHLRCQKSERMETSVSGLYAIGDCTGLGGAPAARIEGEIAGAWAAAATGYGSGEGLAEKLHTLTKHRTFQSKLWKLYDIAPRDTASLPDETTICRCEELTLGDVRVGLSTTPGHVGT